MFHKKCRQYANNKNFNITIKKKGNNCIRIIQKKSRTRALAGGPENLGWWREINPHQTTIRIPIASGRDCHASVESRYAQPTNQHCHMVKVGPTPWETSSSSHERGPRIKLPCTSNTETCRPHVPLLQFLFLLTSLFFPSRQFYDILTLIKTKFTLLMW